MIESEHDAQGPAQGPVIPAGAGTAGQPIASTLRMAHVVYGLHSFAILVGVVGSASVVGSFLGSVPSIAAVVLNYATRADARGTWLESHYRWQIRTFWFALGWVAGAGLLFLTFIGIPLAFAVLVGLTLWLIYRIARGWRRLADGRPMYA